MTTLSVFDLESHKTFIHGKRSESTIRVAMASYNSTPRNFFPINFKRKEPTETGDEQLYNVDNLELFNEEDRKTSGNIWERWQCCLVEPELVFYKLFYFFFHAATALFAYLPLYYKETLLLHHHHVGILMGVRPFCRVLGAPFLGTFADKFNKYKSTLYAGLLVYIAFYLCIAFVSDVPNVCGVAKTNLTNVTYRNDNNGQLSTSQLTTSSSVGMSPASATHSDTEMPAVSDKAGTLTKRNKRDIPYRERLSNGSFELRSENSGEQDRKIVRVNVDGYYDNVTLGGVDERADKWWENQPETETAGENAWPYDFYRSERKNKDEPERKQATGTDRVFIILLLLTLFAEFVGAPIDTLADTATLQSLKKEPHRYGHQRFWASIGFLLMSIITGSILHYTITTEEDINGCPEKMVDRYRPVFYSCCALLLLALVTSFKFRFRVYEGKDISGCAFFRGMTHFYNFDYCLFAFLAWFTGLAVGLTDSFLFVHLIHLGATPMVLVVTTAVQGVSNAIFYYLSPMLLVKYGHFSVIYAGLVGSFVTFLYYSFLKSPWMVVPIEVLAGLSSSCVWASLVSYVGAPPKIGATLQGILHAIHIGMGRGIGGLFGGMIIVSYGFDILFRSFSLLIALVLFAIIGLRHWRQVKEEPIYSKLWDYSPIASNDELGHEEYD